MSSIQYSVTLTLLIFFAEKRNGREMEEGMIDGKREYIKIFQGGIE